MIESHAILAAGAASGQWDTLIEVLVLLGAALFLGTLAEQLRQSAILGYLLAGTLVGPNVLGWVGERQSVEVIAEVGVAMLLFSIGLEFSFKRLRRLGRVALLGGTFQVLLTLLVGFVLGAICGLNIKPAIALGAMVSLSSTACVLRLLVDRTAVDSVHGRNALGILLLQDVAVVPLMLLMTALGGEGGAADVFWTMGRTLLAGTLMVVAFFGLFNYVAPRLLNIRRWARNRELPIILAVVMAIGSATAAQRLGLSPAMGAFLAGILLGESVFAVQIRADVSSLRTVLVTLFFASVGMLGEPAWVAKNGLLLTGTVAAIIIGKALVIWIVVRMLGYSHGQAAATGLCLGQVGEFSFVLAEVARHGTIDEELFRLIVSAMIATLFLTPFLVDLAPRLDAWISSIMPVRRVPRPPEAGAPQPDTGASGKDLIPDPQADQIFIIGFGPAGQRVAEALIKRHRERVVVIDLNPHNAAVAHRYGLRVHLGNACHVAVLEHAHIHLARVVVLTLPDSAASSQVIHLCRDLAPGARLIARARYHVYRWELMLAGAEVVLDEEELMGLRLAAEVRKEIRDDDIL